MKRVFLILCLSAIATGVYAARIDSLIDDTDRSWQFSMKPEFKLTQLGDDTALLTGLQLGPSLERSLYLGLAFQGLMNSIDGGTVYNDPGFYDFWYAGLTIEYAVMSEALIHGSVGLLLGGGQMKLKEKESGDRDDSGIFVAEPGVNIMMNLTKTLELGVGGSYRYVNGAGSGDFSDDKLSDFTGSIFLRWTESDF